MSSGDRDYRRRRSRSHDDYHYRRRSRRSRSPPKRGFGVSDGFMKEMAKLQKDNQVKDLEKRRNLEAVIGDAANVVGSFGKGGTAADILVRQTNQNDEDSESHKSESDGHKREDRSRSRRKRKRKRRKFSARGPDDQKWSRGRSLSDSRSHSRKRRRRSRSRSWRRSYSRSVSSRSRKKSRHSRSRRNRSNSRSKSRSKKRSRSRRTRKTGRYQDPYVAQQKRDNAMLDYFQKQDAMLPPTKTVVPPIKPIQTTNILPVPMKLEPQPLVLPPPPPPLTPTAPIIVARPILPSSKPIAVGTPIGLESLGPLIDTEKLCCLLCRRKFKSLEILKKHELKSDLHRKNIALKRDGALPTS